MNCFVYKSLRKADAYVYLARRDDFEAVPAAARAVLGALSFVLEVDLDPPRRLARVDVEAVRASLLAEGFFIQMPPPPGAAEASGPRHPV